MAAQRGYKLSAGAVKASGEAVRFGRRFSLESRNQTPTPSVGFAAMQFVTWPVQVTGEPITVDPANGEDSDSGSAVELYPAVWLIPNDVATGLVERDEVWLLPFPGSSFQPNEVVLARLAGRRPTDGRAVYVAGSASQLFGVLPQFGLTTYIVEGNTYIGVYPGCGLEFDENGAVGVDAATLVGDRATTALVPATSVTEGQSPCAIAFDRETIYTVPVTYVTDVSISYPGEGKFRLEKTRQTITDRYNRSFVLVDRVYDDPVTDTYTVDPCDLIECCDADPLDVVYSADPIYGNAPLEVDFTATPSNGVGPFTYFWDFDDGNTSTSQNPTHTFEDPGIYEVVVRATDTKCGQVVEETIRIYVSEPCACAVCDEEGFPLRYGWTLSGATGDFAGANGAWTVYHTVDCSWFGFNSNGWSVSLAINSDQTRDIVFVGPDLQSIVYETDAAGCCSTIAPGGITFVSASAHDGDTPVFATPGIVPLDGCEPCGVTVACCAESVPTTLNWAITAITGSCSCITTTSGTVTYDAVDGQWESIPFACLLGDCEENAEYQISCVSSTWYYGILGAGSGGLAATSVTCSPFSATFNKTAPGGSYTITFTAP
jgi:PKD repeat protein